MNYKLLICFTIFQLILSKSLAQDYPREEIDLEDFIEELFQQQDEDIDYEDLYESLFQYYRSPLNLNRVNREELASLYVLSEMQLNNFFKYREKNGKFLSEYELQAIPGFDLNTIYKLMPFIEIRDVGLYADNRNLFNRIVSEKNNYLMVRYQRVLEDAEGYLRTDADTATDGTPKSRYLGSPDKLYLRYRVSHIKDFSLGFTLEKDAGEQITWFPENKQYGTDFSSYHFMLYNKGNFKSIVIGDYQMQFGQGLLLAAGFSIGKGSETITTIRRSNLGIKPYTSVTEGNFFRGAAATYNLGFFDITGFYSNRNIDGRVTVETLDTIIDNISIPQIVTTEIVSSNTDISGLHRTESELSKKQQNNEQVYGGNFSYKSKDKNLNAGLTFVGTKYSVPIVQKISRFYRKFEFNGSQNYNIGLNFSYNWQNFNFFGETAQSMSDSTGYDGRGLLAGFISSLSPKLEMSMLYRNYDRGFHTFYGGAFGESYRNINEQGLYWGIKLKPVKKITITAYYDRFKFPWLKYRVDAPSQGYEYLARVTWVPKKRRVTLYGQYKEEIKEINQKDNLTNIDFITNTRKRNYIVNLNYKAKELISFKSRVQFSSYKQSNSTTYGYAVIQDVNFDFGKLRLSVRFALFDTDDWDNRQYVYEKDVLWAFSLPVYYAEGGSGIRTYLLLRYKLNRKTDIWLKYARFRYSNQNIISSGLNEIQGSKKSEIKVQIKYKF